MKSVILFLGILLGVCLAIPNIPDLDEFEELKERCNKKGGTGTFEKVKAARLESQTCLEDLVDIDEFKKELEESKKTGSMDDVFNKYCKKREQFRICVKKTYDAAEPCLEQSEKNAINFTANVLQQVGDFACFKEGDRLAMFVAEGGADCLKNRTQGIQNCLNETIKFNPETFTPSSLPNLIISKKSCDDMVKIRTCVVKDLEDNCSNPTPANIIEALFKFVRKVACKDVISKRSIFSE